MSGRELLDLIALVDDPAALAAALRSGAFPTSDDVFERACPASDRTTRRAGRVLLMSLGASQPDGAVSTEVAQALADAIELALDLRAELAARQVPQSSQLFVTATSSAQVAALRQKLQLGSLFQLVEDVIRSAGERCVLGAPYWNVAALARLRPALLGIARRRVAIEFVCQSAGSPAEVARLDVLRRSCVDLRAEGAVSAEVWAFDVRDDAQHQTLLHAKFAVADDRVGYLGSANMTGQGFAEHFEIGVRLGPPEVADLNQIVKRLRDESFLVRQE